jgi:hypothetical protein
MGVRIPFMSATSPKPTPEAQFDQSFLGRGVSLTKQESQTRVPSFSVKSTLRLESISAPHLPHRSSRGSSMG